MVYSHSQLKTFDECQLRFRYRYIDKIPEPATIPSPALQFGTIIHKCLELLYKKIQSSGRPLTKLELIDYFHLEMWKFRDEYNNISDVPFPQEDFNERILLWEEMLDWYYDTYNPFNEMKVNWLEQNINFELPNTSKFRWVIDRLDIKWEEAVIVDYKTDKSIAPYWAFSDTYQQQLTSYAYWVMNNYPHVIKSVKGKLIYLRLQQEITWEITSEMLQQAIDKIVSKIAVIEDTLFHYNMGQKDLFVPKEWMQCRRCAYQVMCPLWKHRFQSDEEVIVSEIWETTIRKLVDKFYHLNNKKKELEDNMKWIKEFLEEYVRSNSEQEWKKLYWEEGQLDVRYSNDFEPKWDRKEELKDFLINEWLIDIISMSINTGKLTKYILDKSENLSRLWDMIQRNEKYIVGWAKEKKDLK